MFFSCKTPICALTKPSFLHFLFLNCKRFSKSELIISFFFQVKVILRVTKGAGDEQPAATADPSNFMSVDKKHRQLTLIDPNAPPASDGSRRVGVAAPKMFAFDALFTQEDSQVIQNINLTMHTVQCRYNIICTVENTIDALYTCIVIIINIIIISASNPPREWYSDSF